MSVEKAKMEGSMQCNHLPRSQPSPLIPLVPPTAERSLLLKGILRPAPCLLLFLLSLLFSLESTGGVGIAEAVHVDGFDADAGTIIATMAGADALTGVFLAMAPFVESVVLATHGGEWI